MKYEINDEIETDLGAFKVVKIHHFEGTTDKSINLYIVNNEYGFTNLVMVDNVRNVCVGGENDKENFNQFKMIGDRLDLVEIGIYDRALASFLLSNQVRARVYEKNKKQKQN